MSLAASAFRPIDCCSRTDMAGLTIAGNRIGSMDGGLVQRIPGAWVLHADLVGGIVQKALVVSVTDDVPRLRHEPVRARQAPPVPRHSLERVVLRRPEQ